MTYRSLITLTLFISVFFIACTKTPEPISIEGSYNVTLYQINNCIDSTENRLFSIDSNFCYIDTFINDERCISNFELMFTDESYTFTRTETVGTTSTEVMETGNYTLVDNNNFIFCSPDCDEVLIVLTGTEIDLSGVEINIVRSDTITGCGNLIKALKTN